MRGKRRAPKLAVGLRYIVLSMAPLLSVAHITSDFRPGFTVCGLMIDRTTREGRRWGQAAGDTPPSCRRVCKTCERMKDTDTVSGGNPIRTVSR